MRSLLWALSAVALAASIGLSAPANAFSSTESATPARNSSLAEAEKAVKAQDWKKAIPLLEKVVAESPRDADAHNYLGYSHRKIGDKEKAFAHYTRALELDPNHRGANEYLGELYLEMNDLPKAEDRLARLSTICGPRCEEYRELSEAIGKFKAGKPRS